MTKPRFIIFGHREEKGGGYIMLPTNRLTHTRVIGKTGSGKTVFLQSVIASLIIQGCGVFLLDPSGDVVKGVLQLLVAYGYFDNNPNAFKDVVVLDVPTASEQDLYFPFNPTKGMSNAYAGAEIVTDSYKRIWPAMQDGTSINIEALLKFGTFVTAYYDVPLFPCFEYFYTDRNLQERLIAGLDDRDVARWLKILLITPKEKIIPDIAFTTLKRDYLFSFNPTIRYALSQHDNILDVNELMNTKRSVLLNLNVDNINTQKMLGSLITRQFEEVIKYRSNQPFDPQADKYVLVSDEVQDQVGESGQSEQAVAKLLAQSRKAHLAVFLANQYEEQLTESFRAALSQCETMVVFRVGAADAKNLVSDLGFPLDTRQTKSMRDPFAPGGVRRQFRSIDEQREEYAQSIINLNKREAYIRLPDGLPQKMKTLDAPPPQSTQQVAEIEQIYLDLYFRSKADIDKESAATLERLRSTPVNSAKATDASPRAQLADILQESLLQEQPVPTPAPAPSPARTSDRKVKPPTNKTVRNEDAPYVRPPLEAEDDLY